MDIPPDAVTAHFDGPFYRLEYDRDSDYAYGPMDGRSSPMCSYQEGVLGAERFQVHVCTWGEDVPGPVFAHPTNVDTTIFVDGELLGAARVHQLGPDEFVQQTEVLPAPVDRNRWGLTFSDERGRAVCVVGYGRAPHDVHVATTVGNHYPSGL